MQQDDAESGLEPALPPAVAALIECFREQGIPQPAMVIVPPSGLLFVNTDGLPLISLVTTPVGGAQMTFHGVGKGSPSVTLSTLFGQEGVTVADSEEAGPGAVRLGLDAGDGFIQVKNHAGAVPFVVPLRAGQGSEPR